MKSSALASRGKRIRRSNRGQGSGTLDGRVGQASNFSHGLHIGFKSRGLAIETTVAEAMHALSALTDREGVETSHPSVERTTIAVNALEDLLSLCLPGTDRDALARVVSEVTDGALVFSSLVYSESVMIILSEQQLV